MLLSDFNRKLNKNTLGITRIKFKHVEVDSCFWNYSFSLTLFFLLLLRNVFVRFSRDRARWKCRLFFCLFVFFFSFA